jgi:hypothetical protein
MPKKLCKQIQTHLRLFLAQRIPSRNNQTLTHHMIHHKKKESIIFLSAIHPNCQNRKYFNSPLSYLSTQYGGLVWVWMAEKKLIDSLSFGVSCDLWEFDYFCWEFSGPGRVRGEFESAYTIFLASSGRKFTQTLFSDLFHRNKPWKLLNTYQGFLQLFSDWQPWFVCMNILCNIYISLRLH